MISHDIGVLIRTNEEIDAKLSLDLRGAAKMIVGRCLGVKKDSNKVPYRCKTLLDHLIRMHSDIRINKEKDELNSNA